jgi:hypothetical protein
VTKSSGKRWWQPATPTAPVLEKTGQRRRPFRHTDPCLHSENKIKQPHGTSNSFTYIYKIILKNSS